MPGVAGWGAVDAGPAVACAWRGMGRQAAERKRKGRRRITGSAVSFEQYTTHVRRQLRAKLVRAVPDFGTDAGMLDSFDRQLLNLVQRDDSRTADSIAEEVPLSPSAIARRLRRL